ncbi:DEAD/DEAH box helicase [Marinibactrum halimedae]|uniref:ATP-dependent RNA helicase n=1 Tax=Marinibactrum halimedae TaxID=1444977 RepID=A0AA37TEJ0_9GAMM|nr:DEAD/DEAH box helicase [Marinibactrum halimedae]MCD9459383.1 DEAD/DEAH box helicase [Marinibactrum halimedae]GLS27552.1 ATP-dependent RNA helicase [Marinibactrum halimedae]
MAPEAPLFSETTLHERLLKALEAGGLQRPTNIQAHALPLIKAGKDLLASAETGSGKTAAYLLPMLDKMLNTPAPNSGARGLIVVPTRELAQQVGKHIKQLASFTKIQYCQITGGDDFKFQASLLRKNPEIIVATPGRIIEHLGRNSTDLNDLEFLVLDEADRMLDMGFSEDVGKIVTASNEERQTLLFSATLSHPGVIKVAQRYLSEPETLEVDAPRSGHSNIRHQYLLSDDTHHKQLALKKLLNDRSFNKALIFTNTKNEANRLRGLLAYYGFEAGTLHSDLTQDQRFSVMNAFRQGKVKVLVATDLAGRGLDVKDLELVIHFDMARSPDDYVHRSGRTGRAGNEGVSICFITPADWNNKARCERFTGSNFERISLKGLEAKYKGPDKVKSSGKAAGTKKKTKTTTRHQKNDGKKKAKVRARDTVNKGRPKRFGPASNAKKDAAEPGSFGDGFAPLKKPKKS